MEKEEKDKEVPTDPKTGKKKRKGKKKDEEEEEPKEPEVWLTAVTPKEIQDDSCRTFIFKNEGHTLGNALRCVITHFPEVTFCGHTIPHPSENEMHLRVQTTGVAAVEILKRGLHELIEVCDHTESAFTEVTEAFKAEHPECMEFVPEPTMEEIIARGRDYEMINLE